MDESLPLNADEAALIDAGWLTFCKTFERTLVPEDAFHVGVLVRVERIAERESDRGEDGSRLRVLRRMHLVHVGLAIACDERAPGAWRALEALLKETGAARPHSRSTSPSPLDAIGACFLAAARLDRKPFETYDGLAPLDDYFRGIAANQERALRRKAERDRRAERCLAASDDERLPVYPLTILETCASFEQAIDAALGRTTARQREVLLACWGEGAQAKAARALGVSRQLVSRQLGAVQRKVRVEMRRRGLPLHALGLVGSQGDGLLRALASTLRKKMRILGPGEPPG